MEDKVLDSRSLQSGEAIRRRRECESCGGRYTTYEQIETSRMMVVKRDGKREPFDREKLMQGLTLACNKRPVSAETLEQAASDIERRVREDARREVEAKVLGDMVSDSLREIDEVAYVRFASVCRAFEDVGQFSEIVDFLDNLKERHSK